MSKTRASFAILMVGACSSVRPITYPSPCVERGREIPCVIIGYEIWGRPSDVYAQTKQCPKWTRADVTIDPHQDYGVVQCVDRERDSAHLPQVVQERVITSEPREVETPEPQHVDLEITLTEAEAQAPPKVDEFLDDMPKANEPPPEPPPRKPKVKRKRRLRMYDD